jgi:hypothetical protein
MRTTRKTPEIPPARGRRAKLQAEAPDLADLVDEKRLTLPEAEAASLQRARIRLERERRDAEPQPGDIWLRSNLPVPETTEDEIIYLLYVLAHSRALAADVKYGRWPLREAVFSVNKYCPFPCEEHTRCQPGSSRHSRASTTVTPRKPARPATSSTTRRTWCPASSANQMSGRFRSPTSNYGTATSEPHAGAGSTGVSTGAGPVSAYRVLRRRRRRR